MKYFTHRESTPTSRSTRYAGARADCTTFALLLVVGAGAIWPFAWWYGWPERWAAAVNKLDGDLRDLNTRIVELFSKAEKESEQTRSRVEDLSSDIENARRGLHIAIENIAELITHKHDQLMASSGEFAKRLMRQLVSWVCPRAPARTRTPQRGRGSFRHPPTPTIHRGQLSFDFTSEPVYIRPPI